MSDSALQLTKRELQRLVGAPRFWAIAIAVALVIGIAGPFGTFESLRILPPVAFNVRRASRDTAVLGQALPAGSTAVFSHYITHHDPAIYPEPERFRPDRWEGFKPSQFEYLPFSAGPRR